MKRNRIKDRDIKSKIIDVRPLNKRESPLDIRKGMTAIRQTGFFDSTPCHEQSLFDNPYMLTGEELEKTVNARKQGR